MWCVYINRTSPEAPFSFSDLLNLQEKVLAECLPEQKSAMLFAEVSPTVTLGARQLLDETQRESIDQLKSSLTAAGVSVVAGARGGKETARRAQGSLPDFRKCVECGEAICSGGAN
jgi:hypothetical protein